MKLGKIATIAALALLSSACTKPSVITQKEFVAIPGSVATTQAPGVVEYTYEEPMVDVVDVPAGLDPEGVYYIPPHQAVVEIRQGRWQYRPESGPESSQ